ncbi:hypothetical protein CHELA1G11_20701 [Hyphomicrobiales bacterium]|nr:hypothetical protein CHELA1G11_20701 [Hyphomicrobiales bacterium]CAH1691504.1 hypothetical protein CHELA1G2_21016 [Hyphomicrobiales bacterium]
MDTGRALALRARVARVAERNVSLAAQGAPAWALKRASR